MSVSPQNLHVEALTPSEMVFGDDPPLGMRVILYEIIRVGPESDRISAL